MIFKIIISIITIVLFWRIMKKYILPKQRNSTCLQDSCQFDMAEIKKLIEKSRKAETKIKSIGICPKCNLVNCICIELEEDVK